jgi:MOSC domain-containing protein YiiM
MIKRFLDSRRTGFYLRVLQEGWLEAGDAITIQERDPHHLTIRELTDIYLVKHPDSAIINRVLSVQPLPIAWQEHFRKAKLRN